MKSAIRKRAKEAAKGWIDTEDDEPLDGQRRSQAVKKSVANALSKMKPYQGVRQEARQGASPNTSRSEPRAVENMGQDCRLRPRRCDRDLIPLAWFRPTEGPGHE